MLCTLDLSISKPAQVVTKDVVEVLRADWKSSNVRPNLPGPPLYFILYTLGPTCQARPCYATLDFTFAHFILYTLYP